MSRRAELTGAILATFAIQAVGVLYYNFLFKQSYIETRERITPGWKPGQLDNTRLTYNILADLLKSYLLATLLKLSHNPPLIPALLISSVVSLGAAPAVLARQSVYEGADTTLQLFSLGYDLLSTLVAGALIWTVQKRLGGNEHVVMVPKKSS